MLIDSIFYLKGNDRCAPPSRVLVVENDPTHRDIIATFLPTPSYFVDFASDGAAGLEKALTRCYDLVLTDLRMPNMSGGEMIETLRKHGNLLGHCQIAVMSSAPYDIIGVSAYLQKPFKRAELRRLVDEQVSIAHDTRARQGYAALHSGTPSLHYDLNGMPHLVWSDIGEHFKSDPRLLCTAAREREQKGWRILLGCKDPAEADPVAIFLRAHGFEVRIATNDAEFSSHVGAGVHAILVDHSIDDVTLRLVREKFTRRTMVPIIKLARSGATTELVDLLLETPIDSGRFVGALSMFAGMVSDQRSKPRPACTQVLDWLKRSWAFRLPQLQL